MHTILVMLGGVALLAAAIMLGYAFGGGFRGAASGAVMFLPVWLVVSIANLWIGVRVAGYSLAEEAPIFVGIFGSLVLVALLSKWWLTSR